MEDEVILIAEIARRQIIRGKDALDVVGHYARPDIFQLQVDERPKRPVTTHSSDTTRQEDSELKTTRRVRGGVSRPTSK